MSNPRLGSSSQLRTDQRGSQHRPPRHMQSQSVKGQAVSGQLLIAASGQIPHNRHKCSGTQLNEPDQLRSLKGEVTLSRTPEVISHVSTSGTAGTVLL